MKRIRKRPGQWLVYLGFRLMADQEEFEGWVFHDFEDGQQPINVFWAASNHADAE